MSSAELQGLALQFEGQRLRFVGTPDNPAWIAADVCDILGIQNSSRAIRDFEEHEKGVYSVYTLGGKQSLATVYEPGLYKLLFKSRKPEAKKFQQWVFKDVLPSIRKYGTYPPPEQSAYAITLRPYTSRIVWVFQARRALRQGFWCVFIEGAEILINVEHLFGPANLEMDQYDLLDGSIGSHWSRYRDGKPWCGQRLKYRYTFPKDDPRGTVEPWSYPLQELQHFKEWLHGEYWNVHFPAYVHRKYGAKEFRRAIPVFTSLGVPVASLTNKA
jgi:prophage antirepressor-like protein